MFSRLVALSYRPIECLIGQDSVNRLVCNPDYAEFLAILKAARNGAVYGAKIRAPHALVYVLSQGTGVVLQISNMAIG